MKLEDAVKILNTFLLADIPEIITQEEFDSVKKSIQTLLNSIKEKDEQINSLIEDVEDIMKEAQSNAEIYRKTFAKLTKANNTIDNMIEYIDINCDCVRGFDNCEDKDDPHCQDCIKSYFMKEKEGN